MSLKMTEYNNRLTETVEASFKRFDIFLNTLQLEFEKFIVLSGNAANGTPYDPGSFVIFDKKQKFFQDFTFINRQRGDLEKIKENSHYLSMIFRKNEFRLSSNIN